MRSPFALGDRIAVLALVLMPLGQAAFGALVVGLDDRRGDRRAAGGDRLGLPVPAADRAVRPRPRQRRRQIGLAYAANTVGAIAGSLAGGFLVLPLLSTPGAWRFAALCLVALGIAAAVLSVSVRLKADTTTTRPT